MEFTAEILCLGNELLIGRTVNKNASDISLSLTKIGLHVKRETTARDELEEASEILHEIINRGPDIIVITGGLGPTHDDIQLEIISNTTSIDLELNTDAVNMLVNRYDINPHQLSESIKKMASLPVNSTALMNSVGAAPGVETKINRTYIYSLPGVPSEMNAILKEEVIPRISSNFPANLRLIEFGFNIRGVGESRIIKITDKIRSKFPSVGFKSHPKRDKSGYWLALHTYKIGDDEEIVKKACENWFDELRTQFEIKLSPIKPIFDEGFQPE